VSRSEEEMRVRPDVLQAALMHRVARRLAELIDLVRQQIPEGIVEPLSPVTAKTEPKAVTPPMGRPWFSVSVINDGPNDCWVVVNSEQAAEPYLLRVDESYDVDMGAARITDLCVWTDSGEARLRIRGVR